MCFALAVGRLEAMLLPWLALFTRARFVGFFAEVWLTLPLAFAEVALRVAAECAGFAAVCPFFPALATWVALPLLGTRRTVPLTAAVCAGWWVGAGAFAELARRVLGDANVAAGAADEAVGLAD